MNGEQAPAWSVENLPLAATEAQRACVLHQHGLTSAYESISSGGNESICDVTEL